MNKLELIDAMSEKANSSKSSAEQSLKAIIEVISEELEKGERIQLIGFGTFETRKRAAKKGRNPQTGAELKIPACTAPAFKAGKALKDIVNK